MKIHRSRVFKSSDAFPVLGWLALILIDKLLDREQGLINHLIPIQKVHNHQEILPTTLLVGLVSQVDLDIDHAIKRESALTPVAIPRHNMIRGELSDSELLFPQLKLLLIDSHSFLFVVLVEQWCLNFGACFTLHVQ